jgi:hypothetical protein
MPKRLLIAYLGEPAKALPLLICSGLSGHTDPTVPPARGGAVFRARSMSTKYWVRQVEIGAHAEAIAALWARCLRALTPQMAFGRLQHRYLRNPAGSGATLVLQTGGDDAEVAGVQCLNARVVHHHGRAWRVAGMADYAVSESHRTLGPALQLMKQGLAVAREQYDWVYGLPNAKSEAVCKRSGLVRLGSIGRWTRLLRSGDLLQRWLPALLAAPLAAVADVLLLLRDAMRLGMAGALRWEDSHRFPSALDTLWQQRGAELVLAERSRALLEWRFSNEPGRWTVSLARRADGSPFGYVVWRLDGGLAVVADFFCVDPLKDTSTLMRGFAWHLRDRHAQRLTVEFFGCPRVADGLRAAGFLLRPEEQPLYVAAGAQEPPPAERWYFTVFDRDGD